MTAVRVSLQPQNKSVQFHGYSICFYIVLGFIWMLCLHSCVYVSRVHTYACGGQKKTSWSLELELRMVVSYYVGASNQTQVLCKSKMFLNHWTIYIASMSAIILMPNAFDGCINIRSNYLVVSPLVYLQCSQAEIPDFLLPPDSLKVLWPLDWSLHYCHQHNPHKISSFSVCEPVLQVGSFLPSSGISSIVCAHILTLQTGSEWSLLYFKGF